MAPIDTERNLLFGLLALQVGLIDHGALFAAFAAWTRDKGQPLADHLVALGGLDADDRAAVEVLADRHLKKHGGDVEKSLAVLAVGRSTRESLASAGGPDVSATLGHVGSAHPSIHDNDDDPDRTGTYSVGSATSDGQRFHILRPHAKGGLGAVFVALDSELDREVALKQILDDRADDPTSRFRFLIEAQITGGLEHPGIVPVYGLGSYGDGRPYYAMRFIRGDSLKEAIDQFHGASKAGPVPAGSRDLALRKLLRRFMDVCNAIDYAHSRGVIHRDIKPANIIVGKYGETLVVDWGLAKPMGRVEPGTESGERLLMPSSASGSAQTLPGSALGTPAYMSPEQAEGQLERLGPRSDVYSLGATLYCLLTGKPPFTGDVVDVIRAVQKGEFRPPRQLDSSIDPALEAICLKAMAHQPDDRYASSRALADDLDRWMADEQVSAWREPLSRRARRWARRNRTAVAAVSVAFLAVMVGLGAVTAVQARANSDLRAANAEVKRVNADLAAEKARVQERYDLAVDAIKTFHTGVSEDFLLTQEQFKEVRDRLLKSASDFYGKLGALLGKETDLALRRALWQANYEVAELTGKVGKREDALAAHRQVLAAREALAREPGSDDEAQADVGLSLLEVGRLLAETGRANEGLTAYDRARAVLQNLADDHPAVVRYRDALARAHHYTGDLHWGVGRYAEGAQSHGRARAIWEALAIANPAVGRFRNDQARSDLFSGANLAMIGRTGEARASFERAAAILQELADNNPAATRFQRDLTMCYNNIGLLLSQTDKATEALAAWERARAIRQKLADAHPGVTAFQSELARVTTNIGILLMETGRTADAVAAQSRAVAILQRLADDNPAVTEFQRALANSLNETGDVLRSAGRTAEAQASYERGLAILEGLVKASPIVTQDQVWLVQGLKGLGATQLAGGRTADAVGTWRRAVAIGERLRSDYGETLYFLACCHALLGGVADASGSGLSGKEGPAELDRAMEILRRAVAAGYRNGTRMRRDRDLDPLRNRPDFRLLIMDLVMPAKPFAD